MKTQRVSRAENQDERVIWVVVELHRPKQRVRKPTRHAPRRVQEPG